MKLHLAAVLSGLVFGLGVTIAGMNNPEKVLDFLDIAGNWDPSLALVLAAATGTAGLSFRYILRRRCPIFGTKFHLPLSNDIEFRLVLGAGIFGIGWGIVGLCPGPAFTTLLLGHWEAYVFFAGMIAGMIFYEWIDARIAARRERAANPPANAAHNTVS
jgi:uncharacterized membrane protein YedE/YeeE